MGAQRKHSVTPDAGADPLVGRIVAERYRIDSPLGAGGMGQVYRATQLSVDRPVALKVMRTDDARGTELGSSFLNEAALAAGLTHPNIVTVYDYGRDGDCCFLVMELVTGKTLAELLEEEGPIAPLRVIHICAQICRALRAAHAKSIIHRDLKPSNVAFANQAEPDLLKVLDFGLATRVSDLAGQADEGARAGSPKYCSPEHIDGCDMDARSDLFSLGIIAYEMLTGRVPFEGPTELATVAKRLLCSVPPVPMRDAPGNEALERVIRRCLAKRPEARYQSTDELLAALQEAAHSLGLPSLQAVRQRVNASGISGVRARVDPGRSDPQQAGSDAVSDQPADQAHLPTPLVPPPHFASAVALPPSGQGLELPRALRRSFAPAQLEQPRPPVVLQPWPHPAGLAAAGLGYPPGAEPHEAIPRPAGRAGTGAIGQSPRADHALGSDQPAEPPSKRSYWLRVAVVVAWTLLAVAAGAVLTSTLGRPSQQGGPPQQAPET
ncbi:MAG: protein kinase [Proteobacteria bacterium]|nr:protein kinase [Pseudomonadota bacterium]